MREELIELFKNAYEGEEDVDFNENTNIIDDLDLSSLEFFSLVNEIEEKYNVVITERELQSIVTIGDVITIMEKKCK